MLQDWVSEEREQRAVAQSSVHEEQGQVLHSTGRTRLPLPYSIEESALLQLKLNLRAPGIGVVGTFRTSVAGSLSLSNHFTGNRIILALWGWKCW